MRPKLRKPGNPSSNGNNYGFRNNSEFSKDEVAHALKEAGLGISDYARYVDSRGMIRFVARKTGEWSVKHHGWREVSRTEAEKIQRANTEMDRVYLKPRKGKYF